MRVSAALPSGIEALFFASARQRRQTERRLADELVARGYSEVILPVVDYLDPYDHLLETADRSELYRLVDRDGSLLALRSDFTPMLARLLAPRLDSLDLPLKVFYSGDVFRFQQERAGGQREFYQMGAEILAPATPDAGAQAEEDTLRCFLEMLEICERDHKRVVVGLAGLLDPLLEAHAGDLGAAALARAVVQRERHVARSHPALAQIVEQGLPNELDSLGEEAAARLRRLLELRDRLATEFPALDLRIDLAEFADLSPVLERNDETRSYYDGLVFRAFVGRAARPLGGGGRYDRMYGDGFGVSVTACGFSLKIDLLHGGEPDATPSAEGGTR